MPSDNVYGTVLNVDSATLLRGMLVRVSATNGVLRAQADSSPHLQGLAGIVNSGFVGVGCPCTNIVGNAIRQFVLLETGLTPAAGETLYVSASVPGRATNVAPGTTIAIGTIIDASQYSRNSTVFATVSIPATTVSGGGAFPGFGGTLAAVGIGISGVSALAARGDHGHPTLVKADAAAMVAQDVTNMLDGTRCYVASRDRVFRLDTTALTTNTWDTFASATVGRQWLSEAKTSSLRFSFQTTWQIDPQNTTGLASDDNTGADATHPLRSYSEHALRLGDAVVGQATTITIRSAFVAGDEPVYQFRTKPAINVIFEGIEVSTVYTGTITTWTPSVTTAAADDNQLVDATVPASFTASGMLADAILFRRTNSTAVYWWAAKDLGGAAPNATLRTADAFTLVGGTGVLANGDSYVASTIPTIGAVRFTQILDGGVTFRFLNHVDSTSFSPTIGRPIVYRHSWRNGTSPANFTIGVNLGWSNASQASILPGANATALSGMVRGGGAQTFYIPGGCDINAGRVTLQGCSFLVEGRLLITTRNTVHDVFNPGQAMIVADDGGRVYFAHVTGCLGGKGNSVPILDVGEGVGAVRAMGVIEIAVATPFVAASTSVSGAILVNNFGYTVAQLPLLSGGNGQTNIKAGVDFGVVPVTIANGAQAVVIGNTGPVGIATPGTPAGYETFYVSGVLSYRPFWQ